MPLIGAHMSIAGGLYKAVEAAAKLGMDCVQIFTASPSQWSVTAATPAEKTAFQSGGLLTKNNNQWRAKPLAESEIAEFRAVLIRTGVQSPVGHTSYLINLASPDDVLWEKSLDAFVVELERAEALGLIGVVLHPGSFVSSSEEAGLERIVRALDVAHQRTADFATLTLLETTAGQGTNLGHRFEHLASILDRIQHPERVGVCVDTCHIFAAGYAVATAAEYAATIEEFDRVIGIERIRAFHLNDSLREFGSRVDRHARIGAGHLGLEPFRYLLNDPRFAAVPMYLETPKGEAEGELLDAINLRTLRGLYQPAAKRKKKTEN